MREMTPRARTGLTREIWTINQRRLAFGNYALNQIGQSRVDGAINLRRLLISEIRRREMSAARKLLTRRRFMFSFREANRK